MASLPNWVDFVILILLLRATYVGYDGGVSAAVLNLLAAVSATSLAINYAMPLWSFVHAWVPLYDAVGQWISFWLLFLACVVGMQWLVRQITGAAKGERIYSITQLLGVVFGVLRGFWWSAVFLIALTSSGLPYLIESAEQRSILGPKMTASSRELVDRVSLQYPGAENRHESLIPGVAVQQKHDKGL